MVKKESFKKKLNSKKDAADKESVEKAVRGAEPPISTIAEAKEAAPEDEGLLDFNGRSLVQGIILSEILGKPRALKRRIR